MLFSLRKCLEARRLSALSIIDMCEYTMARDETRLLQESTGLFRKMIILPRPYSVGKNGAEIFDGIVLYFPIIFLSTINLQSKNSNCAMNFWNQSFVALDHRDKR